MHTEEHIFRWGESWPWALVDWHQVARRVHAHPYPPTLLPHFGGDTTHHSVQRSAGKGAGLQRSGVCDQDGVAAGNDPASEYRVMVCDHAAPHREPIVSGQVVALFIRHRLSTRRPRPVNMSCSRRAGPLSMYVIRCTAAACVAAPVPRKCACGLAVVGLHQKNHHRFSGPQEGYGPCTPPCPPSKEELLAAGWAEGDAWMGGNEREKVKC